MFKKDQYPHVYYNDKVWGRVLGWIKPFVITIDGERIFHTKEVRYKLIMYKTPIMYRTWFRKGGINGRATKNELLIWGNCRCCVIYISLLLSVMTAFLMFGA